ncbi:MAG: 3-deoxy-manno-octulosonate cytidylyltransferase [Chlamydiales bacterium]
MMKNKKLSSVVGIIPARYGSVRYPGKMLAIAKGKPLVQLTYENALTCPLFDDVIIATDDRRIYDCVQAFGGKVVMTSPHHLTGTDRIVEVIQNDPSLDEVDLFFNIQGDEPCVPSHVFESVTMALDADPEAVMATAVMPLEPSNAHDPSAVKCVLDCNGNALYFSRAFIPFGKSGTVQQNTPYYHHLGIYCFRREFLLLYGKLPETPLQKAECLEQLKVLEHGYRIKVVMTNSYSIGVDTPEDLVKLEQMLCN